MKRNRIAHRKYHRASSRKDKKYFFPLPIRRISVNQSHDLTEDTKFYIPLKKMLPINGKIL